MSSTTPPSQSRALTRVDRPEHAELRELERALKDAARQIATLDEQIDLLRAALRRFEIGYHQRLAHEHLELAGIDLVMRHVERWHALLSRGPKPSLVQSAERLDRQRQEAAKHHGAAREAIDAMDGDHDSPDASRASPSAALPRASSLTERDQRLKRVYRALVRRHHPDLADSEGEARRAVDTMTRINALYHAGDLDRLLLMFESEDGEVILDANGPLPLDQQVTLLTARLARYDVLMTALISEHEALEQSDTYRLMRALDKQHQADPSTRPYDELQAELRAAIDREYANLRAALYALEAQVTRYNREAPKQKSLRTRGADRWTELAQIFDPYADKRMIRLGLEHVTAARTTPAVRQRADWVAALADSDPPLFRLLLLTYVAELSPRPVDGLERMEDLELRWQALAEGEPATPALERVFALHGDLVEFGVRRASPTRVQLGPRFRDAELGRALDLAIGQFAVRQVFRKVLAVLGAKEPCARCKASVFTVPLFRTRGLDDLRALVCPSCGDALKSYWMPAGDDVQSLLNRAYLELDLVSEWSFSLAQSSVGIQLVPAQVERMTISDLKKRLHDDLLIKNGLQLKRAEVRLMQAGKRVREKQPLSEVVDRSFAIALSPQAGFTETELLELIRHNVRRRFRTD